MRKEKMQYTNEKQENRYEQCLFFLTLL